MGYFYECVRKKCEIVFCFINEMAKSVQHLRSMWMWKFLSRLRKNLKAAECNEIAEFLRAMRIASRIFPITAANLRTVTVLVRSANGLNEFSPRIYLSKPVN